MSSSLVRVELFRLFPALPVAVCWPKWLASLTSVPIRNLITGAIGGVGGGNILGSLLGAGTAAAAGGGDLGSILTQIVGGGVSGPILTVIVALIRNAIAGGEGV